MFCIMRTDIYHSYMKAADITLVLFVLLSLALMQVQSIGTS